MLILLRPSRLLRRGFLAVTMHRFTLLAVPAQACELRLRHTLVYRPEGRGVQPLGRGLDGTMLLRGLAAVSQSAIAGSSQLRLCARDQVDVGPQVARRDLDEIVALLLERSRRGPIALARDGQQDRPDPEILH